MSSFLCGLWPILFGGLLGWLICGLMAHRLKYAKVRERVVEKTVEKPVDRVLEKEVTVEVDNPEHIQRISELEAQLEDARANSSSNTQSASGSGLAMGIMGAAAGATLGSSNNAQELVELKARNAELEAQLAALSSGSASAAPEIDLTAAKAAGFKLKNASDFTVVEGIGPKINELIHADGIDTFFELSQTSVDRLQSILDRAGKNFALAKPGTWPKQAGYAAHNRWEELKLWQDELDGGV